MSRNDLILSTLIVTFVAAAALSAVWRGLAESVGPFAFTLSASVVGWVLGVVTGRAWKR